MSRLSNYMASFRRVYAEHGHLFLNPRFIRRDSEITWDGGVGFRPPGIVRLDDVLNIAQRREFSLQFSRDGSVARLHYKFDEAGEEILSASLGYYSTRPLDWAASDWNERRLWDVAMEEPAEFDGGFIAPIGPEEPTVETEEVQAADADELDEEAVEAGIRGTLAEDDTPGTLADAVDVAVAREWLGSAVRHGSSSLVSWFRLDYDPDHARGVIHPACHLHAAGIPLGRVPFVGVPTPQQFLELVLLSHYPAEYENYVCDESGMAQLTDSRVADRVAGFVGNSDWGRWSSVHGCIPSE